MVSPAYLVLLVDFHYWARDRVLDAVAGLTPDEFTRDLGNSFKSVHETLVHLLSAEWVWYERWQGRAPLAHLRPEDFADVAALRHAWSEHESRIRAFIGAQDEAGLARVSSYTLFNGTTMRSPLWQMVTHVVNHGTYHRGQTTTMLRQLGAAPPKPLDLIAYYRERMPTA